MIPELRELYQQVIIDHGKRPRNFFKLDTATHHAEGFNPLCGDRIALDLSLDGDTVADVAFEGAGCAISTASASIMTQLVKGRSVQEIGELFDRFHEMVAGEQAPSESAEGLGKLEAFAGVRRYPARVKCATLAWHTLKAALEQADDLVTTE